MKWAVAVLVLAACGGNAGTPNDASSRDAPHASDAPPTDAPDPIDAPTGVLSISPTSTDFGAVAVTQLSVPKPFTITNTGTTTIPWISMALTNAQFVKTGTTCVHALTPGASCEVDLEFVPTVVGDQTGSLNITSDDSSSASATLHGTTTSDTFLLSASPVNFTFGLVPLGQRPAPQRFTLSNVGVSDTAALVVTLLSDPTQISIVADACTGVVVPPAGTCSVDVAFTPTIAGLQIAHLSFDSDGQSVEVGFDGSGSAAKLSIFDSLSDFGSTGVDMPSAPLQFTISNHGTAAATSLSLVLGSADFVMASTTCGATLAVNAQCTEDVVFSPVTTGFRMTTLLATATYAASAVATLTGLGTTDPLGFLAADPGAYDFNSITVGSSATFAFTITNQGASTTSPIALTLGGPSSAAYAIAMDACSNKQLTNLESCTFSVVFAPTLVGTQYGNVVVSAVQGGTVTVSAIGTGT